MTGSRNKVIVYHKTRHRRPSLDIKALNPLANDVAAHLYRLGRHGWHILPGISLVAGVPICRCRQRLPSCKHYSQTQTFPLGQLSFHSQCEVLKATLLGERLLFATDEAYEERAQITSSANARLRPYCFF